MLEQHDELVRDILVAGICDERLSEQLQLDGDLTLAKTVTYIRQSEKGSPATIFSLWR